MHQAKSIYHKQISFIIPKKNFHLLKIDILGLWIIILTFTGQRKKNLREKDHTLSKIRPFNVLQFFF